MSPAKRLPLAMELFKKAKAYQISAERLCERFFGNEPVIGIPMSDPIYYLYHHAAELALKALLLSNNIRSGNEHRITVLLRICREANLLITANNDQLARNLSLSILSEDRGFNYRYPGRVRVVLDLRWVRKAIPQLLDEITPT